MVVVEIDSRRPVNLKDTLLQPPPEGSYRAGILIVPDRVLGQLPVVLQADKVVRAAVVKLLLELGGNNIIGGTDNRGQVFN